MTDCRCRFLRKDLKRRLHQPKITEIAGPYWTLYCGVCEESVAGSVPDKADGDPVIVRWEDLPGYFYGTFFIYGP